MTVVDNTIPFAHHRARIAQYLRGISFPGGSVAAQIIEERRPAQYVLDPLRPSFVLWACGARGGNLADALPVAAAFDLFDRFLLLHDELAAQTDSTVARWGLGQSLNAGDALYALAFRCLASDVTDAQRRLLAARIVAEAVLAAIESSDAATRSAALTAAALEAGAIIAQDRDAAARVFAEVGRCVAMAAFCADSKRARREWDDALAALGDRVPHDHLQAFDEVARYLAPRAV
jgi:geranylgeranyl pyrophosphate synthase